MANYTQLKDSIIGLIKENGNEEITGDVLQNVLTTIVSVLGDNSQFKGLAVPATTPGTPDGNVFYIAKEIGIYSNFGGYEIKNDSSVIFKNTNSGWDVLKLDFVTNKTTNSITATIDSLSINKININNVVLGSYINGQGLEVADAAFLHTGFLRVKNIGYSVKTLVANYCTIVGFDDKLNVVSGLVSNSVTNGVAFFTPPTGVEYVVVNLRKDSLTKDDLKGQLFLNEGSVLKYLPSGINILSDLNNTLIKAKNYDAVYSNENLIGSDSRDLAKKVLMQGDGVINTRRFELLNNAGKYEYINSVYTPKIISNNLVPGESNFYLEYDRPVGHSSAYPFSINYNSGSILSLWINYNVYTNIRVHFSYKNTKGVIVYDYVQFTPNEILTGNIKTKNTYSLINVSIKNKTGNYCQIDIFSAQKANTDYDIECIIYDATTGGGNTPGVKYHFFGFNEYFYKKAAIELQQLSNILPKKQEILDETNSPGNVELIGNKILEPTISIGYTNVKTVNNISNVNSEKINTTKRGVSSTIYPFQYNLTGKKGTFGIWLNKTEYEGKLRLQISLLPAPVSFVFIDLLQSEFTIGKNGVINNENVSFDYRITEKTGDYYFFEINYLCLIDKNVVFIPYEQNNNNGAVQDKNYTHLLWMGKGNPYNKNQFFDLSRISTGGGGDNRVKLVLPNVINLEYNKTVQIFKHCIVKAFNYKNYNIQVLMNRDAVNGKDYNRYFQYAPQVTGEVEATFKLYDNNRYLLDEKVVKFNIVNRTTQPEDKEILLFVGDSLTFYGRITDEFVRVLTTNDAQTIVPDTISIYNVVKVAGRNWGNINLIGTQKTNYLGWTAQTYHEGYSGWGWNDFTKTGSPFYINGNLDFNAYLTNNGFNTPTVVYIGLGWNDQKNVIETSPGVFDVSLVMSSAKIFLDAITTQLPNTKIRLWTENVPGTRGGIGNHPYGAVEWADEHRAKLIQFAIIEGYLNLIEDYTNVGIVWSVAMIDSENSLQETNAKINTRINNTEVIGKDYVHPADAGFFQITDALISDFVTLID